MVMKAFRICEPGRSEIISMQNPEPGPGEVLLKIRKVGFCGSDLASFLGRNPNVHFPRIPGHEIAGTIVKIADGVPDRFTPNMNVTVVPYTNCGACPSCRRGRVNACQFNQTFGVQRDGAMVEYLTVPWNKLVCPESLSLDELALVEPLTIGFHAIDRAVVDDSDTVLVLGCGMIGLGAIARAMARGARVIAGDIADAKLETARLFGAVDTVDTSRPDAKDKIMRITNSNGPDVMIEASGSQAACKLAVETVAFAGRVVCIGYVKDDVGLATKLFVQKEINLLGSRNATVRDFDAAAAFLSKRSIPLNRLISRQVPFTDAGQALADWAATPGSINRIIIDLD